jgi:CRISPR-associated protein Cmr4
MKTLYLHALSPIHVGTGQASASFIDLPVAREKATNWPMIPGSGIKGVCRDAVADKAEQDRLFGQPDSNDTEGKAIKGKAGALQFGDGRLLCLPVRSWEGIFAWVTCPLALHRLIRDAKALRAVLPFTEPVPNLLQEDRALVADNGTISQNGQIWLQDLSFTHEAPAPAIINIARGIASAAFPLEEVEHFIKRFIIVSDNIFSFLTETGMEVAAHVKIDDKSKTTIGGGLWYVESVPAEALFTSFIGGDEDLPIKDGTVLQFGGDENTGRGLCRLKIVPPSSSESAK